MSGKEIFFKDLDANTLDALKRYEQQFVYDEDLYVVRRYSYKEHVNSMSPKFDLDYVMANDPNKQKIAEYGNDTTFTDYYDIYYTNGSVNRIPYNSIIDTICMKDILDILPLADYRKDEKIYKELKKPLLKYLVSGQKFSLKDEVKRIIDFLIDEDIIMLKEFTDDLYASVRNRFVNLIIANNVSSKYYNIVFTGSGWSSNFIIGDIATIPSNKKYLVRLSNTYFSNWQDPRVYYEIHTFTEDIIYNTGLPGDDVFVCVGQQPFGFYTMIYGKKVFIMKNIDHYDTGDSDTSLTMMYKLEVKQYT